VLKPTAIFTDEIVRGSRDSNGLRSRERRSHRSDCPEGFDQESKSDFVETWNGIQLFFAPRRREFVQERLALFFERLLSNKMFSRAKMAGRYYPDEVVERVFSVDSGDFTMPRPKVTGGASRPIQGPFRTSCRLIRTLPNCYRGGRYRCPRRGSCQCPAFGQKYRNAARPRSNPASIRDRQCESR
jgi:hypothetical protein